MEYSLEVKNLTKRYKDFALDNVSLGLPYGSIMGFVGENGAGKSTTINLILNLISREGGTVTLLGKDNKSDMNEIKEFIGVVFDDCCFPQDSTCRNINLFMKNIYKTWDEGKFYSLIKQYSLAEGKPVKEFSKGMKMKLSIAAALSHGSKLLILDEATSGLDIVVRNEVLDLLLDFVKDKGNSVFISSHIVTDLEKICDYLTFIHKGRIVFSSPKSKVLEKGSSLEEIMLSCIREGKSI